jgi:hypothetical protein
MAAALQWLLVLRLFPDFSLEAVPVADAPVAFFSCGCCSLGCGFIAAAPVVLFPRLAASLRLLPAAHSAAVARSAAALLAAAIVAAPPVAAVPVVAAPLASLPAWFLFPWLLRPCLTCVPLP